MRAGHPLLTCGQLEEGHGVDQSLGLVVQAAGRCGHLFHQSRILLSDLIHLGHRFTHLADALALLIAGSADLTHQVRHALDRTHHFRHGGAGLVYQRRTLLHPFHAVVDQGLDLLGRLGRATSQAAHFAGHHGKATALLARAGGFHGSVQCQDVRLEGNAIDHANDVGDLARAVVDALHGFHHLAHYLTTLHRHSRGAHGQLVGLAGVVRVLAHGRIELLHGRSRLLQGAGLLLRPRAQIVVARSDFRRSHCHALRAFTHMTHDAREAFLHL